jgi:hypothetical protein
MQILGSQDHKSDGTVSVTGATALPITKIGATSSANTTFTEKKVTDASAWTLSSVLAGDTAVTSDGYRGVVTSTGANIVYVNRWESIAGHVGTPADTSTVAIHRLSFVRRLIVKAGKTNDAIVYVGLNGTADSTNYPLNATETINIGADGNDRYIDVTRIYAIVESGTQSLSYAQGGYV